MGNLLTRTMDKGERIMPVPQGAITSTNTWKPEQTAEVKPDLVEEVLPEAEEDEAQVEK